MTDSARVVSVSPELRALLVRSGVPASERRPLGDDTVVFHVATWQADSAGVLIEFKSAWTTILGRLGSRCRTGSVNYESVRVRHREQGWSAEPIFPVMHGDDVCVPIGDGPGSTDRPPPV